MNERIEQLARQVDAGYIPRYDMWQMDSETVQKFAELIVRDTLKVTGATPSMTEAVKKHFGVE
jgi:ABC-type taurine transport system substrate-binding protein